MNLIVAVDNDWAIGKKNGLLYHLPEDLKFFKEKTIDKVVVMGDNTAISLPNGKPLPKRTTIIMSLDKNFKFDDCKICHNLEELGKIIQNYNNEDIFVCGGGGIYKLLLNYCKMAYVTKIFASSPDAEIYFPNLDDLDNWKVLSKSDIIDNGTYKFQFVTYINSTVLKI